MGRRLILLVFPLVLPAFPVQSFPTGAPSQSCSDLRPDHGGTTQTTPSPFELDMDVFQDVELPNLPTAYSYVPSRTYDSKSWYIIASLSQSSFSSLVSLCSTFFSSCPSSEARSTGIRTNSSIQRDFYPSSAMLLMTAMWEDFIMEQDIGLVAVHLLL